MPRKPKEIKMCNNHKDKSIVLFSGEVYPLCSFAVALGQIYHDYENIDNKETESTEKEG